jgi:hypothetical protein
MQKQYYIYDRKKTRLCGHTAITRLLLLVFMKHLVLMSSLIRTSFLLALTYTANAAPPPAKRDVDTRYPYTGPAIPAGDWVDPTVNGNGKGFPRLVEPLAVQPVFHLVLGCRTTTYCKSVVTCLVYQQTAK